MKHLKRNQFLLIVLSLIVVGGLVLVITGQAEKDKVEKSLPKTITGKDGAEMVLIPAGTFEMGSAESEIDQLVRDFGAERSLFEDEVPRHTVHVDSFYMDKYEVTNVQFKKFLDANPQWRAAERGASGNSASAWRTATTSVQVSQPTSSASGVQCALTSSQAMKIRFLLSASIPEPKPSVKCIFAEPEIILRGAEGVGHASHALLMDTKEAPNRIEVGEEVFRGCNEWIVT